MSMKIAVALILGLATLLGWARLWLWHRAAQASGHASTRRVILLALLQPVSAGLLHLALFLPSTGGSAASLRIATAGTSRLDGASHAAPLILLPEAPAIGGGEAAPDLATALRRNPSVREIEVLGNGLGPRDVDAARSLTVRFAPPPLRPGIVDLAPPPTVAPGTRFIMGGKLTGLPGATVELLDPADHITDSAKADKNGRFILSGTARAAGTTHFMLRVRSGKRVVEQADVPVWVVEKTRPRLLILAGAPGPEVKYLRRWASDAGFDVTTRMSAGGGIVLGDAPIALDAASLRRFDVAVVDDRAWPGSRGPLLVAVRGGMGLVLRAGGTIDAATRSQWQALGFSFSGPGGVVPLALPKATEQTIARTRRGIGSTEAPVDMALPEDMIPDVSHLGLTPGGADAVALMQDAGGVSLAAWRAMDEGRVALFTPIDSYGLTLTGRGDLYSDWWSDLLSAVARPGPSSRMATDTAWVGERMSLCELTEQGRIEMPDGRQANIVPVAACGAFWPVKAGWHYLRVQGKLRPFYVQPRTSLPVMRAARDRQGMAMLRNDASSVAEESLQSHPQSAWPYWLAWLAVSTLLWWLERSRLGRRSAVSSGVE